MHRFVIRGTRGTIPVCGQEFVRHGGHTTCFSLHHEQGVVIIDAGTGITSVGSEISACSKVPPICLLFTHFHLDHIVGLPCFAPLYDGHAKIKIMADPKLETEWKKTLTNFMAKPYWPVRLGEVDAVMDDNLSPAAVHGFAVFCLMLDAEHLSRVANNAGKVGFARASDLLTGHSRFQMRTSTRGSSWLSR